MLHHLGYHLDDLRAILVAPALTARKPRDAAGAHRQAMRVVTMSSWLCLSCLGNPCPTAEQSHFISHVIWRFDGSSADDFTPNTLEHS